MVCALKLCTKYLHEVSAQKVKMVDCFTFQLIAVGHFVNKVMGNQCGPSEVSWLNANRNVPEAKCIEGNQLDCVNLTWGRDP